MNRFDIFATKWDTKPQRVQTALAIADSINTKIADITSARVLDYGCGTGLLAFAVCENLGEKFCTLVGMDSSQEMLKVFDEKANKIGYKNFSAIYHNANDTKNIDGKYNLIISSMTMHHIKDYKRFIKDCCECLDDGGYLAIGDILKEDGTFHSDNSGVEHFGFEMVDVMNEFSKYLKNVSIQIAQTIIQNDKEYHIFTAVGKK